MTCMTGVSHVRWHNMSYFSKVHVWCMPVGLGTSGLRSAQESPRRVQVPLLCFFTILLLSPRTMQTCSSKSPPGSDKDVSISKGKAYWTITEEAALIDFLFARKQEGKMTDSTIFKDMAFWEVALEIQNLFKRGVEKNMALCKPKWRAICVLFFMSQVYLTCMTSWRPYMIPSLHWSLSWDLYEMIRKEWTQWKQT